MKMKAMIIAIAAAGTTLSGCASDRIERRDAARGALIGAAAGGALSAVTGGGIAEGAAIGAAGGAAIGYVTSDGRRREVRRDRRGNRYWMDDRGRRHRIR